MAPIHSPLFAWKNQIDMEKKTNKQLISYWKESHIFWVKNEVRSMSNWKERAIEILILKFAMQILIESVGNLLMILGAELRPLKGFRVVLSVYIPQAYEPVYTTLSVLKPSPD